MSVSPQKFADFFCALHDGREPFPWQTRLLHQVVETGWPRTLALPTASGKTACLDIALFALACGAKRAPRRIFFVVDRRVIVDEAHERARRIAKSLREAKSGILAETAASLTGLAGADADPLAVFQLRGGVYRDDAWARTPSQPTIICSTVDQIGSRLLFRSYGARPYAWPLHAGLAANDALILLDEAHCANPFKQTLEGIERYRKWAQKPIETPFSFVVLSATPGAVSERPFELNKDDRANLVLSRRLNARKPARLIACKTERTATEAFAERLVKEAQQLARAGARRIGIIVNRVAAARMVHVGLDVAPNRKALFIGRMRPLDRDALLQQWQPVFSVESQVATDTAYFAVATQCLEVGANFDFDALITECASLDALRQRFGRLFRVGEPNHIDASAQPVAAVVMPAVSKKDTDPIYGHALVRTWEWLEERAKADVIDFGIDSLDSLLPANAQERAHYLSEFGLVASAPEAPVMLPAHLDCFVQTSPTPWPEPEPALFLHGPRHGAPDVQVCWRNDLNDLDESLWAELVALAPPSSAECMSVPLHVFRRWFKGEAASQVIADASASIENQEEPTPREADAVNGPSTERKALVWRGPDESMTLNRETLGDARPGETIVLSESAGGWDTFGALANADDGLPIALDYGDEANLRARGRATLRLTPSLVKEWPITNTRDSLLSLIEDQSAGEHFTSREFRDAVDDCLKCVEEELSNGGQAGRRNWTWLRVAVSHLVRRPYELEQHAGGGFVLIGKRKLATTERQLLLDGAFDEQGDFSTDDDSASFTVPVLLSEHLRGVADFATAFARACRLPDQIVRDVALAASLHDLGKSDPRFQSWLRGGSPFPAELNFETMQAKSGGLTNALARRRARERAGYPAGGRHELLSVQLAQSHPEILDAAHDSELVLHLVASHHGRCRPFAPVVDDPKPLKVELNFGGRKLRADSDTGLERLDSGVAQRFWTLVRRYGWWGLAYLEAIHVLADHRRSEAEQREKEGRDDS